MRTRESRKAAGFNIVLVSATLRLAKREDGGLQETWKDATGSGHTRRRHDESEDRVLTAQTLIMASTTSVKVYVLSSLL